MSPELKREIYRAIERGGHEVPPDAVTFLAFPEFPPLRMRLMPPPADASYNMGSGVGFRS